MKFHIIKETGLICLDDTVKYTGECKLKKPYDSSTLILEPVSTPSSIRAKQLEQILTAVKKTQIELEGNKEMKIIIYNLDLIHPDNVPKSSFYGEDIHKIQTQEKN